MRLYAATLLVGSGIFCGAQGISKDASPIGVWRQKSINWENAPKDLGYKERAGNGGILRFSPDGSFTLIYTVIYQRGRYEQPSQGDAWTIYQGAWKQTASDIEISYSMIYRDIRVFDTSGKEKCPPPLESSKLKYRGHELKFDNVVYIRSPKLEPGVNKTFHTNPQLPPFKCPQETTAGSR
jgi:hypothetical protein